MKSQESVDSKRAHIITQKLKGSVRSVRPLPSLNKSKPTPSKKMNMAIQEKNKWLVLTSYKKIKASNQSKSLVKCNNNIWEIKGNRLLDLL